MEYYKHLKEKFPFYLSSGIICAILVFLVTVLNSYRGHLEEMLIDRWEIARNRHKVVLKIKEIDAAAAYLYEEFDMDAAVINPDALIFKVIDEIKINLKGATLRVVSSKGPDDESIHYVEIAMPIKDYSMLVQSFHYLESFRIPKYRITKFSLRNEKPGEMMLRINGNLVMPSL